MDWIISSITGFFAGMSWWQIAIFFADYLIKFLAIGWVPENRSPSASTAWLLLILLVPFVGLPLFLLLGSHYITGRRHELQSKARKIILERTEHLPDVPKDIKVTKEAIGTFQLARLLTGMPALTATNHGVITRYNESFERMIHAIDHAKSTVHVQSYIFALDETTEPVIEAIERAHNRGLEVKVLVDPIGSWKYPGYYRLKKRLKDSGVPWHPMLPVSLTKLTWRRLDLRNHRKMVIIDGNRVFMGSQNIIEPEYQRRSYHQMGRQWVDTWVELTGEIALAFDAIFAVDWSSELHNAPEAQADLNLSHAEPNTPGRNIVQVLPSGPGFTTEPNLRVFNDMIYQARERIIVVSPYFVPDESLLMAITSAAYSGVDVQLYVNEKSDQFMVGHAQQSYYQVLLEAGVRIFRYPAPKILHSKFLVIDDSIAAFGSSNLDMRSFGLNYEITLLAAQGTIVDELIGVAERYQQCSKELTVEQWAKRSFSQRYLDSVFRLTSALQ